MSEAYQVLRDGRRRKAYDAQLASGAGGRIQLAEAEAQAEQEALEHHMGRTPNGRRFFNLARGDIDRGDLAARSATCAWRSPSSPTTPTSRRSSRK